jgi:hypothetical protein
MILNYIFKNKTLQFFWLQIVVLRRKEQKSANLCETFRATLIQFCFQCESRKICSERLSNSHGDWHQCGSWCWLFIEKWGKEKKIEDDKVMTRCGCQIVLILKTEFFIKEVWGFFKISLLSNFIRNSLIYPTSLPEFISLSSKSVKTFIVFFGV